VSVKGGSTVLLHNFNCLLSDFKILGILKRQFPGTPIIGLTATATSKVIESVKDILDIPNCVLYKASFNRPNLFYEVYVVFVCLILALRHCDESMYPGMYRNYTWMHKLPNKWKKYVQIDVSERFEIQFIVAPHYTREYLSRKRFLITTALLLWAVFCCQMIITANKPCGDNDSLVLGPGC
jgi:hypothetical protein